jgi:hypothetical protein
MIALLSLLAMASEAADGAPAPADFAAEAIRICVETRADPAVVKALAQAEGWTTIDPATGPGKSSVVIEGKKKKDKRTFERNVAWTVSKGEAAFTVGLFDFPEAANVRQCDLIAWDLDFDAVDAAFRADVRFKGNSGTELPFRMYRVAGPAPASVSYLSSDTGTKQLHLVTVNPLP